MEAIERLKSDIDNLNAKISTESDAIKTLVTDLRDKISGGADDAELNAVADQLEAATARIDAMLPADPASTTPPVTEPPADVPPSDSSPAI